MTLGFFGSTTLTVACMSAARAAGFPVSFAVSQPDSKKDRHGSIVALPVSRYADEHGIAHCAPEKINDAAALEQIRSFAPDIIVVVAYGQMLSQALLDIPRTAIVNIHASLLPRYRGASPIEQALLNGDRSTGVTLQKVVRRMDAGDIIMAGSIDIDDAWGYNELHDAVARAAAALTVDFLADVSGHLSRAEHQDEAQATYCYKIAKEHGRIDWNTPARSILNKVRAFSHWPVAFTALRGKMLKVFGAAAGARLENMPNGSIIDLSSAGIRVNASDGSILLTDVQWEGKKRQTAKDFLNGARLVKSEILG